MKKFRMVLILPLLALAACGGWFTPAHVADLGSITKCALENAAAGMPPAQVAAKCGAENEAQIVDLLAAHKAFAAKERAAACPPAGAPSNPPPAAPTSDAGARDAR